MEEKVEYQLLISFPDQSPSFVHGAEFGGIYQRAKEGYLFTQETVHAANREVLIRMCKSLGQTCEFEPAVDESGNVYDEWLYFTTHFSTDKPKESHLSLVK
jgi:hypothetical protein